MPTKASEWLVWAVDTLAVSPGDRLLEVGCGVIAGKLLAPEGALSIFGQPPAWKHSNEAQAFANLLARRLSDSGLSVEDVLVEDLKPVSAVCLVASVAPRA